MHGQERVKTRQTMVDKANSPYRRANLGWIVLFVAVSGAALVRLIVATIDNPSLLWNALLVIPLVGLGMWLIGYAMSFSARLRHRFLTERDPGAIHLHATHLDQSLSTLSRLGLADTQVMKSPLDSASLQFTDESLEIWIGGKSPHLVASLPRTDFTHMKSERTTVTAVNPAVSVTLEFQFSGVPGELVFVPAHAMGRPLRPRRVDELLPSLQAWIGIEHDE